MTIRLRGLPFKTEEDDIIKFFHPLQPIEVRRRYLARRGVLRPIFYLVLVRGALPGTVASQLAGQIWLPEPSQAAAAAPMASHAEAESRTRREEKCRRYG